MASGGDGVISVVSNIVPRLVAELCSSCATGDFDSARSHDALLAPIIHAAFIESNPIPVKAMLHMTGRMQDVLRLPLVPLADTYRPLVRDALLRGMVLSA
jgi:4-hydroxy-tetrahydrodipicolinate synthase